jgi:predicted transcriptional regulator
MSVTSIRIEDALEGDLNELVEESHRSKGWIINEALRSYLENRKLDKKRWQDTLEALEDIRMGRVVDGDKVHAWLESWGTDNEIEAPIK